MLQRQFNLKSVFMYLYLLLHAYFYRSLNASGLLCLLLRQAKVGLELMELLHETKVGIDDVPSILHKLERFLAGPALGHHKEGHDNRGRTTHACMTVHQHLLLLLDSLL